MLKKICPVCDLPLKPGNYCPVCRKVVRRPNTWEVDYYLNENHPRNEAVCGYHNPQLEAGSRGSKGTTGRPAVGAGNVNPPKPAGRQAGNQMRPAGQTSRSPARPTGQTSGNPARPVSQTSENPMRPTGQTSGNPVRPAGQPASRPGDAKKPWNAFAGAGIAIVCVLLSAGVNIAKEGFKGITSYYEDSQSVEIEEDYDSFEDYGYHELDEAEIIAAGKPCDGYFHFPGDSSQMIESMGSFLKNSDFGYRVSGEDLYTYNYEALDDKGKFSYYQKIYSFTMEDESTRGLDFSDDDYLYQYVDINYDTVTGLVHEYNSCFIMKRPPISVWRSF